MLVAGVHHVGVAVSQISATARSKVLFLHAYYQFPPHENEVNEQNYRRAFKTRGSDN